VQLYKADSEEFALSNYDKNTYELKLLKFYEPSS